MWWLVILARGISAHSLQTGILFTNEFAVGENISTQYTKGWEKDNLSVVNQSFFVFQYDSDTHQFQRRPNNLSDLDWIMVVVNTLHKKDLPDLNIYNLKSSLIACIVALADKTTPGTPAPGCVPAPTK